MIILASNSWLRKIILESSKIDFKSVSANIDERLIEKNNNHKKYKDLALLLAESKAEEVNKKYPNDLIIGADTFAILPNGEILHKPRDHNESIELCMKQSGNTITVITGMVMVYKKSKVMNISETKIKYINFNRTTIKKLLINDDATVRNSGLGFYSDAPGFSLVESFEGSYTGAMGLPMEIVRKNLKNLNYT